MHFEFNELETGKISVECIHCEEIFFHSDFDDYYEADKFVEKCYNCVGHLKGDTLTFISLIKFLKELEIL